MNIKGVSQEAMNAISRYSRRESGDGTASAEQKSPARELSDKEIAEVVDRLNSGVRDIHERLSFSYHEKTRLFMIGKGQPLVNVAYSAVQAIHHFSDLLIG